MEQKFKVIKEKIQKETFDKIHFSDVRKQKVLNQIRYFQQPVTKSVNLYKKILSGFISLSVITGLFFFTLDEIQRKDFEPVQQETFSNTPEPHNKASDETAEYIPPKQEENYNEMTKEEILERMLNTVDHFETAKGEFKINYANTLGETVIEYELSLNSKAGGYSKENYITDGAEKVTSIYYKDGTMWEIDGNSGSYMEMKYLERTQGTQSKSLKIEDAFSVDNEGNPVTNYRERPFIGQAMSSLFPYEIASNYTRDLNSWDIEKQNEELLGHNTLVLTGKVNGRDFHSFRFWVDKDTGILVKYETYNQDGKVVDYLYPTKLEINVPVDSKSFIPNLTGYEKVNMTNQDEPRMNTGNIDELIPKELKSKWEAAKKKQKETTILHLDGKWYILAKKGYLVDRIESNGKEGTLYLAKVSPQKSQFMFHALAEGYKVETLKIVYE
jgi:outer membrane lipoprotein-sorting protein